MKNESTKFKFFHFESERWGFDKKKLSLFSDFQVFQGRFFLHTYTVQACISDQPPHAMYHRLYFYFRYIVFHLSTWPPLFQIRPPTCIVRRTFHKALQSPLYTSTGYICVTTLFLKWKAGLAQFCRLTPNNGIIIMFLSVSSSSVPLHCDPIN